MQTKSKRKQWALLAFTMIATFVLQIITPLTANAEEQTYGGKLWDKSYYHERWTMSGVYNAIHHFTATSNKPYETALLSYGTEDYAYNEDYSNVYTYNYIILFKDINNLNFTYESTVECMCTTESCSCSSSSTTVTEDYENMHVLKDGDENIICYYLYFNISKYDCDIAGKLFETNKYTFNAKYKKEITDSTWETLTDIPEDVRKSFIADVCDGTIPPSNSQFDESTATYDDNIPAPKMKVDNKLNYQFINDDANYMYQVKGRWRSIDDVTVNTGTFTDKLFYKSTVQCDLLQWVSPIDETSTSNTSSFATIGKDYFYNFLTMYPIENRNIYFPDTVTNYDNWYEVPKYKTYYENFKDCLSSLNSVEVYVRYFVKNDDGTFSYGKWTHYYNNMTKSGSSDGGYRDGLGELTTEHFQSENGLTSEELKDVENLDDSRTDTDINSSTGSIGDIKNELDFEKVTNVVLSLYEQAKVLFSMFSTVFSFLPTWVTDLIGVSVILVCFVGIWKVIR